MADKVSVYEMTSEDLVAFALKSAFRAGVTQSRFTDLEGLAGLEMQYLRGALMARLDKASPPPFRECDSLRQKSGEPLRLDGTVERTLTVRRVFYVDGKWEIEFVELPLFDHEGRFWPRYDANNFELVR